MKKAHVLLGLLLVGTTTLAAPQSYAPNVVKPILDDQQQKALTYFTTFADPASGLAHEGNNRGDGLFITVGGSGFGVMALICGVERGWITRSDAALQLQKAVKFLGKAKRVEGVWPHWLNTNGTARSFGSEQVIAGDLVETSFMMAGLLAAREYFDGSNAVEKEIRDSTNSFWNTINWQFYTRGENVLYWAYDEGRPSAGNARWVLPTVGWNEGLITYLMALAAPSANAISKSVYTQGWLSNGAMYRKTRLQYGYPYTLGGTDKGGPLFLSQYSFLGLDPRYVKDTSAYYWEQQLAHVMVNRHYCLYEASAANKYDSLSWGLSACYGVPGGVGTAASYLAREPDNDDGVIAPTAAVSSMPYTPFYSLQVLLNLANQGANMQGSYGFVDSYSPKDGKKTANNLAIDQGPMVVMIENYRSGLIWNLLMKAPEIQSGLALADLNKTELPTGFSQAMVNTKTKVYDMVRHPDRGNYELPYYVQKTGTVLFVLKNTQGAEVRRFFSTAAQVGYNICTFSSDCNMELVGQQLMVEMFADEGIYTLPIMLR